MAVMITGGTGFLGSYLARRLLNEGGESNVVLFEQAVNLDRIKDIQDRVTVVQGDVLDPDALLATMQQHNIDRVVHLAYLLGMASARDPAKATQINCTGTVNVFEAARQHGVKRIVYASSAAAYGSRLTLTDNEVDEDARLEPNSMYGICKVFNEHLAAMYVQQYGMDMIGFRPVVIFGPTRGNPWTEESSNYMILPELAARGLPAMMPPNEQVMDWVYVADAAVAWHLALAAPGSGHRVYNLSAERRPAGDVTRYVQDLVAEAKITINPKPMGGLRLVSTKKVREELRFEPRYTMEQALSEYLDHVRRQIG